MNTEHLVSMANQISLFFESQSLREEAVRGVSDHLRRFWEPRMRDAIVKHFEAGGEGLCDIARAAIACLAAEKKPVDA